MKKVRVRNESQKRESEARVMKKARVRNESDETKEKDNLMNVIIILFLFCHSV